MMNFCCNVKLSGPMGRVETPLVISHGDNEPRVRVFPGESVVDVLESIIEALKITFPKDSPLGIQLIGIHIFPEIE